MTPVKKVCVITGGTSGIGLCTAQAMLEKGYTVYELSRRAEGAPGMKHIMADVTKEETLAAAVQEILTQEDHIDVLINNAGFGISGAVEFTKTEDAQHQLDVNFFGMVRMNRQVLPVMRRQCHGQMRCWLLPNGRIFSAAAGLFCVGLAYCACVFLRCPPVGATRAFIPLPRTHSQAVRKTAHSGDTRLTARCGRSPHPQGRLCRSFSRAENRHYRHA